MVKQFPRRALRLPLNAFKHLGRKVRQSRPQILLIVLTTLITALVTVVLTEPAKLLIQKSFFAKHLIAETISISDLTKNLLPSFAADHGIALFNFDLDDDTLTKYYVITLRFSNVGASIGTPQRLAISLGGDHSKVLDVKFKTVAPRFKDVALKHNIPQLVWDVQAAKNNRSAFGLSWAIQEGAQGFFVYSSLSPTVGFGRISALVRRSEFYVFDDTMGLSRTSYFAVSAFNCWGESEMTEPLAMPEMNAFEPFFKNVVWIDPQSEGKLRNGTLVFPFHSLQEAISQANQDATLIVAGPKPPSDGFKPSGLNVLYADDLSFLHGSVDISFPNGIDDRANVLVFVLAKCSTHPNEVQVLLKGSPDVVFDYNGVSASTSDRTKSKPDVPIDAKTSLTPIRAFAYRMGNAVILAWEPPHADAYSGVRVFRSKRRSFADTENIGVEVYDGPGMLKAVTCNCESASVAATRTFDIEPPPKPGIKRPSAPQGLRLFYEIAVNSHGTSIMPFFIDASAKNEDYSYTVFGYDSHGSYGLPIIVNCNSKELLPLKDCVIK
jgi:hypothetical protein